MVNSNVILEVFSISEFAWRTVVIQNKSTLKLENSNLSVCNETEKFIPISQIRHLIIESNDVTISVPLINKLSENDVNVIICDKKYNPTCEMVNISNHSETAKHIYEQTQWTGDAKNDVWQNIIMQKIRQQRNLLENQGLPTLKIYEYECTVMPGDKTNREGQVARLYFKMLFGNGFIRHTSDDINSALNYGYTLIQSAFTRIITMHGYHTALGINHTNKLNRFNLSCDLMEPFRPFVDKIVYENKNRIFDWEYKKLLIELLQFKIHYGGKEMVITDVAEHFALDVIKELNGKTKQIKEIGF